MDENGPDKVEPRRLNVNMGEDSTGASRRSSIDTVCMSVSDENTRVW